MKVVITTHFSLMQQVDEYPAFLNVDEDNGYSLESIKVHNLSYVPLNWKRKMRQVLINIELKWTQSFNPEYIIQLTKK